jgi:hypothetical protein
MDIQKLNDKYIGKEVFIQNKKHPHYKECGEILGVEYLSFINSFMIKVKGEYNEFFVKQDDIQILK